MINKLFSDDLKTQPFWWDDAPRPDLESIALPKNVEVLIIGSGYTGLSAALQTTRGGRETLVVDAMSVGWGCSSRNGGQVSNSLKPDLATLSKKMSQEKARAVIQEGFAALDYIDQLIKSEQLECDWRRSGRFVGAHNKQAFKTMHRQSKLKHDCLELPWHLISASEMDNEIGSDFYHGGQVYPDVGALHPGKYHLELLRIVQQAGARVIGDCAVQAIKPANQGFIVLTSQGEVTAQKVLIASNGYTSKLSPWQQRRVIPIGSYIIATEPISTQLMDELLPTDRVVIDTRKLVYYYRACPERRRILFGGRVALAEGDPVKSAPILHNYLCQIFPQLENTRISHSWMGYVAYTFDHMPHTGTHEGIDYCMGYCGSGISLASYFGMKMGKRALGDVRGNTPLLDVSFPTRPLYAGKPWFLAPSILYYQLRDKMPF